MTRKTTRRCSSSRTCPGRLRPSRRGLPSRLAARFAALAAGAATLVGVGAGTTAEAQQPTFHLDRVEVPGSPDDTFVLFRPYTRQSTIFFAQMALGYSLDPLHTANITSDKATIAQSSSAVIQNQFTMYANIGFELFDRFIFGLALPITWIETGQNANYALGGIFNSTPWRDRRHAGPGGGRHAALRPPAPSPSSGGARTARRPWAEQLSVFFPTGTEPENFGSDGAASALVMVNGDVHDQDHPARHAGGEPRRRLPAAGLDQRADGRQRARDRQ